jgi:hypothetical protein
MATAIIRIGEISDESTIPVSAHCLAEILIALCNEAEQIQAGIHGNMDLNQRSRLMKDAIKIIECIARLEKLRDTMEEIR